MLTRIHTSTITGIDAVPVDVEVQTRRGEPAFHIIGLGDSAIRESKHRVIAALETYGCRMPDQVLVNLAPAEMKKEGSAFDLPIAVGILAACGKIPVEPLRNISFHGELALDGTVRRIQGAIALAAQTVKTGLPTMMLPSENVEEALLIDGITGIGISSLLDLFQFLKEGVLPSNNGSALSHPPPPLLKEPFADVIGQESAKRALTIAAAGGHNILMIGPPGCGKSMLAQRFPALLPCLQRDELLEVIKIHSISGQDISSLLTGSRPFRSPHHSISTAGLIGGGSTPKPGEISLAHKGVLFLDEFPEYGRAAIEALRLPLEAGLVDVARARCSLRFPAEFQLIAAMNPCPCGRQGIPNGACMCTPANRHTYLKRLSQPILDRIDMHVELQGVPMTLLCERGQQAPGTTTSQEEEERVQLINAVRLSQARRHGCLNARLKGSSLRALLQLKDPVKDLLEHAAGKIGLSTRAVMKVLKVGRTIADLEEAADIGETHIAEALSYRCLERMEQYLR